MPTTPATPAPHDTAEDLLLLDLPVETARIDKFICDEMARQVRRYIKAMSGSKDTVREWRERLERLAPDAREHAVAHFIARNREVVSGLDIFVVVARAMANYCDTFAYLSEMLADRHKMAAYARRLSEKYLCWDEVYEENGKFGVRDANGRTLLPAHYDFLRETRLTGEHLPLIAGRDGKMGLVWADGRETEAAPFIYDYIALRDQPPFFEAVRGGETVMIDGRGGAA